MNIDKSKLRIGTWYEDNEGNMYKPSHDGGKPQSVEVNTYNVCFPLEVSTRHYKIYDNKDTCKHPLKYRKRTGGWVKGIKGCECTACGKTKVGKSYIPFMFMPWDNGPSDVYILSTNAHLSKFSQKCVVAMVNSGDYELDEAIVVMANACERCMNVLIHKYLNGEDGYEEYSEEWNKANTFCDFCK
jgi:hypothetical protein